MKRPTNPFALAQTFVSSDDAFTVFKTVFGMTTANARTTKTGDKRTTKTGDRRVIK